MDPMNILDKDESPSPTSSAVKCIGTKVSRGPAPRVPRQCIPPDLPARAADVTDVNSLARVIGLLCTCLIKTMTTGKSVSATNKRLVVACASEAMQAVEIHKRLSVALVTTATASDVAAEVANTSEVILPATPPTAHPDVQTTANGSAAPDEVAANRANAVPPVAVVATLAPEAIDGLKRELAACVRDEFGKVKAELERDARRAAARDFCKTTSSTPTSYARIAGGPPPRHAAAAASCGATALPAAPMPTTCPAIVVDPLISAKPAPAPKTGNAIIVSAKGPVNNRQEAITAWRQAISFKTSTYAPVKVIPISNNKLRIEFSTTGQRDETLARLKDSGKVSAVAAKKSWPMFILKGISKDITSEELIHVLKTQNPGIGDPSCDGDVQIRFLRHNKNPTLYNAVLSAEPTVWRKAIEMERVNIDHQKVRVNEFTPFLQCHTCLQFGHTSKNYGENAPSPCAYCASATHKEASCPERERKALPKCYNCVKRNTKFNTSSDESHKADSPLCPVLRAMKKRVESNIDYGL